MSNYVPSGKIYLISNVDIDNSYAHEYYFANATAQYNFFKSKTILEFEDSTYQRKNNESITLQCNADTIRNCKYLMWKNENVDKWYYAFVTSVNYENPNTSIIFYQLDVYQTYLFDIEWKQCLIDRMHCQRWLSFGYERHPIFYREKESLEYGDSYITLKELEIEKYKGVYWAILCSNKNVGQEAVGSNYAPNLEYYMVPIYFNYDLPSTSKLFTRGGNPLTPLSSILYFFKNSTEYVNSLVSVYITKYPPALISINTSTLATSTIDITSSDGWVRESLGNYYALHLKDNQSLLAINLSYLEKEIDLTPFLPEYTNQDVYKESKLLEYPYTYLEVTNGRGESKILHLENFNINSIYETKFQIYTSISPFNCSAIVPEYYLGNKYTNSRIQYDTSNILYDLSDNSLPINDDYCASYLQSNINSLNVAQSNARAFYDTAMANTGRDYSLALLSQYLKSQDPGSVFKNGLATGITAFWKRTMTGSEWGMQHVSPFLDNIATMVSDKDLQIASHTSNTNRQNSEASALTEYESSVASTLAKISDAEQVPPQTKNISSSPAFYLAHNLFGFRIRVKTIMPEYRDKISEYFNMYGYKVNKFIDPSESPTFNLFNRRPYWNYVKMSQVNISGNIPDDDLKAIKGIFSMGITLWKGDYVGSYYLDNSDPYEPGSGNKENNNE